jgi:hypothetical protein
MDLSVLWVLLFEIFKIEERKMLFFLSRNLQAKWFFNVNYSKQSFVWKNTLWDKDERAARRGIWYEFRIFGTKFDIIKVRVPDFTQKYIIPMSWPQSVSFQYEWKQRTTLGRFKHSRQLLLTVPYFVWAENVGLTSASSI